MKTTNILATPVIALSLLLGIQGCTPDEASPSTANIDTSLQDQQVQSDREAIEAILNRRAMATQANNIAALDSLWSDGQVFLFEQGGADSSWVNYRDHHLIPELDAFEDLTFRYEGVQVRVNGDMALATGRYILKAHVRDRDIDSAGVFTSVLERQNEIWKIIHSHTSRRPNR